MIHTCLNNLAFFLDLLVEPDSTSFFTLPSLKSLSTMWDLFDFAFLSKIEQFLEDMFDKLTNMLVTSRLGHVTLKNAFCY